MGCDDCRGCGNNCGNEGTEETSVRGDGPGTVTRLLTGVLRALSLGSGPGDSDTVKGALTAAYEAGFEDGYEKARNKAASEDRSPTRPNAPGYAWERW